ncbi:SMI1/KNR4 family protein [Herbidospora cretacea]|uniref:SMI1/KNR4 family protein n=1 Tax=Herbidospora cretacea TaxID=28444 RepID=UPI000A9D7C7C|nr:SMI1/KNR4 family protein [Herbidospora cretacea]
MASLYAWSTIFPPEEEPLTERYPDYPFTPESGLHAAADEPAIRLLEERLGMALPPSYRDFLRYADGMGDPDVEDEIMFRASRVGWLRDLEPDWITHFGPRSGDPVPSVADADYFVYGPGQRSHALRGEYLPSTLLVGHRDDGVYLLNPEVVTPDGEWEAWYLAPWLPGAVLGRSFWDLMNEI